MDYLSIPLDPDIATSQGSCFTWLFLDIEDGVLGNVNIIAKLCVEVNPTVTVFR
jgi:hypothetical protein